MDNTNPMTMHDLAGFIGSENLYRYAPMGQAAAHLLLTDGVHYLAERAACHWLLDVIFSAMPKFAGRDTFITVELALDEEGDGAQFRIHDGNGNDYYTQAIEYTDFPLKEIKLFGAKHSELAWIVMLPSEY